MNDSTTTGALEIRSLGGAFGAEIVGIDASRELSSGQRAALHDAWLTHSLLLFRDQDITSDQQVTFASAFGEVECDVETSTGINYVSNLEAQGLSPLGPLGFHHDHSMYPNLLSGIMLYGLEVPPLGTGGNTLFASAVLACRALPPELRSRIDNLHIRHGYVDANKGLAMPGVLADGPKFVRPLVLSHPATKDSVLFLSRQHADQIVELSREASDALIEELAAFIERPEHVYRHEWRRGDLVVWDNIALQHGRSDFDPTIKRHLRRLQLAPL